MKLAALLHLVTVVTWTAIALVAVVPAQARLDGAIHGAPYWLDQTIYRPNCLPSDCACDCRLDRLCLPACVR
jgi:hypothetical protein